MEIAKGEIIAMTDAGCVADRDWLKNLTLPFSNPEIDVAAGFYKMTGRKPVSTAMGVFLGTQPKDFDIAFLPSTRSVGFRKSVWEKVGGFPERLEGAAEDTVFDFKLVKNGFRIARVKNAVVEWGVPADLSGFFNKIKSYALWDAKSKVWIFPGKGLASHNVKALFILVRYIVALAILLFSLKYAPLSPILIILFLVYLVWAWRKVYLAFGDWRVAIWGPVLQVAADLAVIKGFTLGIIGK